MADEEVSLRPMSLRPGGGPVNPFAGFGKGAGFGIRVQKAAATDEAPRKRTGEAVRYSKEFLLKFMERYTKCPIELSQLQSEIVLTEDDPERDAVRQNLQRMAEETDDKDNWRTRTPLPPVQGNNNNSSSSNNNMSMRSRAPMTPAADLPKLQKAEELGRQAYRPGAMTAEGTEKAIKVVKGVLNKLTPEKFERLLGQLLEAVTTAEILQHAITMVFENAVAQPTFCALYAELCLRLSKELPEFPPKEGEQKALTFKRVLLNTCQDEFEAAAGAREELKTVKADMRELAERKVKMRTLGNVRLISELYKKNVVNEKIMHVCVREMLSTANDKTLPPEDNIEAVCEMITTAGKQLAAASASAPTKGKQVDALSGYLARLERIASNSSLPSRLRFLIRDVLDLKKANWNPRREVFTAKKLDEVRAQAEAELGLVPSNLVAKLPVLPALQQAQQQDEMDLLPPLRGGEDGWETVGKKGATSKPFAAGSSALLGDYKPPERPSAPAPAAPAPAAAAPSAPAPAKPSKPLTAEEFSNKCGSMYREYVSVRDVKEAITCVRELRASPSAVPDAERGAQVVAAGVDELLNAVKEADQDALVALLVALCKEGAVAGADLEAAMKDKVSALEDLSLDVPLAPKLLGKLLAATAGAGILSLAGLPAWLEPVESADPRRAFVAAGFRALKSLKGEDALKKLATDAKLAAGELLKADPEFDGDLPSVADFLREQGLSCLPL